MSERTPRSISETAQWTAHRVTERMAQLPVPLHLPDGEGYGFKVIDPENESDARTIGVFPEQNYVSITTPDVTIKIKNANISAAKDGISIEAGDKSARALFLKDGHIAVEVFPSPALALPESHLTDENPPSKDSPESSSQTVLGASDDAKTASQETTETARPDEQKERQPRVTITGRLGAAPHFEQSPKSGLIARFPVAENAGEEHVTWHRVYSTGEHAQRTQDA